MNMFNKHIDRMLVYLAFEVLAALLLLDFKILQEMGIEVWDIGILTTGLFAGIMVGLMFGQLLLYTYELYKGDKE